jgi:hypothetical protein
MSNFQKKLKNMTLARVEACSPGVSVFSSMPIVHKFVHKQVGKIRALSPKNLR